MSKSKLSELSDEELLKNEKALRKINAVYVGVITVLLIATIFQAIFKGFNALNVIPIAFLPILIVNLSNLKAMKEEIKSRNL